MNHLQKVLKTFFLKIIFFLIVFASCKAQEKPNILFIAVDDLRPELNCYGQTQIISPNVDKLAAEGMSFSRAYCNQAICMPSRASLFSGYRPDTLNIFKGRPLLEHAPGVLTLNQHFKNNGYQIGAYGKLYHWNEDNLEQFGSIWSDTSRFAPKYGRNYVSLRNIKNLNEKDKSDAWECINVPDEAYIDGEIAAQAVEKIAEFKNSSNPFFLAVGFHKPHLPFNAPKKYWDLYDPGKIHFPSNYFPIENATKYTMGGFPEVQSYTNIPNKLPLKDSIALNMIHGYYACVSYTDAQIGRLINALEENGFSKNTIVVLWGDHGWKLGEHMGWGKHTAQEIDLRVPLIVSTPKSKNKGEKSDAFVELVDIYPTLCELAGLEIPPHVQGDSFFPVLQNPDIQLKEAAYSIWPHNRQSVDKCIMGYSVRTNDYRYTEWYLNSNNSFMARELYHLSADPHGNKNVVDMPDYRKVVDKMKTMLYGKNHKIKSN